MDKKYLELAIELRRELHQNPELSYQETRTKQRLMDFLREHTSLELVDKGRWFYAAYRKGAGKRNIAFRADMDALPMEEGLDIPHASQNPGVSHKCGHDGHSATMCAFAMEIDKLGSDNNIFFLFQHAEETAQGAIECVELIDEEKIDEIFAFHNWPGTPLRSVTLRNGTMNCASEGMSIYMKGKPAHASAPEEGRNPSFAIAEIIQRIPGLIRPEDHRGLVLCTVVHVDIGKEAYGMSASEGVLRMTIRGEYEEEMAALRENLQAIAGEQAQEFGLECSFEYKDTFPETANHPESADKVREACKKLGIPQMEMKEPMRGSEDYGCFLKHTKGTLFFIGTGENVPYIHTYGYDFPDDIIETGVELYLELSKT